MSSLHYQHYMSPMRKKYPLKLTMLLHRRLTSIAHHANTRFSLLYDDSHV
jgi:hypothetical protein